MVASGPVTSKMCPLGPTYESPGVYYIHPRLLDHLSPFRLPRPRTLIYLRGVEDSNHRIRTRTLPSTLPLATNAKKVYRRYLRHVKYPKNGQSPYPYSHTLRHHEILAARMPSHLMYLTHLNTNTNITSEEDTNSNR